MNFVYRSILSYIAGLLIVQAAIGQPFKMMKLSSDNGLTQNNVGEILQDKHGRIWLGTQCGLNCYNGYEIKRFIEEPGNPFSMKGNQVEDILEDTGGNIWVITLNGINKYIPELERFKRYQVLKKDKTLFVQSSFFLDSRGDLFLFFSEGMYKYEPAKDTFLVVDRDSFKNGRSSHLMVARRLEDKSGRLWIAAFNGLFVTDTAKTSPYEITGLFDTTLISTDRLCFDEKRGYMYVLSQYGLLRFKTNDDFISSKDAEYVFLNEFRHGFNKSLSITEYNDLWLGTQNGLYRYSIEGEKIWKDTTFFLDHEKIKGVDRLLYHEGLLWFSSDDGFYYYNYDKDRFTKFEHKTFYDPGRPKNETLFIYADRDGSIWISELKKGIYQLINIQNSFKTISSSSNTINTDLVFGFYKAPEGEIWLGTRDGVNVYNPGNGDNQRLNLTVERRLSISSILKDSKNNMWFGMLNEQIYKYDPVRKKLEHFGTHEKEPYKYEDWAVTDLLEDENGNIWVSSFNGISRISPEGEITSIGDVHGNSSSISNRSCLDMFLDSQGFIWVATRNGLNRIDNTGRKIVKFFADEKSDNSLPGNHVSCVTEDKEGNIWVGTVGNGIAKYDRKTNTFSTYNNSHGLVYDVVVGMLTDDHGDIWISTFRGLSRLDPKTGRFDNFFMDDGLNSNEFNHFAFYKSDDGELFFGGTNGVTHFYPEDVQTPISTPDVYFMDFKVNNRNIKVGEYQNGQVILDKAINYTRELKLKPKNRDFSIDFSIVELVNPGNYHYRYMLEGYDRDWIFTRARQSSAGYTNLPGGQYNFKVQATNRLGRWEGETRELAIRIVPPFWKTTWFWMIIGVAVLGTVSFVIYVRSARIKKQNKLLTKLVKERTYEIEKQKEELQTQANNLQEINHLLNDKTEDLEAATEELKAQSDELYLTNEELHKLNATKDKFFSIIAHDLKNPFMSIMGFSDLLIKSGDGMSPAKRLEMIQIINDSSKNSFSLLENLLYWARSQTNNVKFSPGKTDLHEVISDTINILDISAKNKDIELKSLVEEGTFAFADKNMITTVIRNIINNAIKFTPEKGSVTVSARREGKSMVLEIADTGVGMEPELAKNLFKIDQQTSTKGTAGESGTGLGLIICKEFMDKNNGEISIESEPGKGSVFRISLPMAE